MPIEPAATESEREEQINGLLDQLDLAEKVAMLSGHGFFAGIREDKGRYCARMYHIGAGNDRLGIPKLLFNDGPRGVAMGSSTCFPVSMARGASFDVELEERIGSAIGREMRAQGGNLFGGVCINLLRHPAWGRAQETYGEDPFHVGELGAALVRGVQRHNVVATIKHFAANSMENARFHVDVSVDERALREVYLRHFERCVREGAGAVMSAYNRLNGAYCGHNAALLTKILKEEWGFDGFVYSDFVLGCRGADACAAGLDIEAPDTIHFGEKLEQAVRDGDVAESRIDDAARRALRVLFRVLAAPDPETYEDDIIACADHRALAREAADKSIVLLKNDGVLPFESDALRVLLVLGELASEANLGDHGSSRVYPPDVTTPLDGLRAALPDHCEIVHDTGHDPARVRELAASADAVLVLVGYTHRDEGEYIPGEMVDPSGDSANAIGGDRLDLTLDSAHEALILAAAVHPKTVVAVMAGSAVVMESWRDLVPGILMLWYPGMAGGAALAGVLLGRVNPSGHLPFSIPKRAEDLPGFDRDAKAARYDLWHGYTHLDREGHEPAYPFGFGLGYSRFELSAASVSAGRAGDRLRVEVDLRNAGERPGAAVVQVYAGWAEPDPDQPHKRLCGFRRVTLAPHASRRVDIDVALRDLAFYDTASKSWRLGTRRWRVWVGQSSADASCLAIPLELPDRTWPLRVRAARDH